MFARSRKGFFAVFKQNVDGSHLVKLQDNALMPSWSPSGRKIAFVRPVGRDFEVFVCIRTGVASGG